MRTEQLKYFVEVAKCHSIGIAAERLFVTQPTVSIALKNLEQELNCILFSRSKNGVFLTEIGQRVLEKSEKILQEEKDIYALTRRVEKNMKKGLSGSLKIATIPMIMHAFMKNTVLQFIEDNPLVSLTLVEQNSQETVSDVINGRYDLGFFVSDSEGIQKFLEDDEMICTRFFAEKVYVVAHKMFGLAQQTPLSLENIKHLPLVTTHFTIKNGSVKNNYYDENVQLNVIVNTYSFELVKDLIVNGQAIGILLNSLIPQIQEKKDIDIVRLTNFDKADVCCLYKKNNARHELLSALMAEMLKHC